jgi:hypothetical protein
MFLFSQILQGIAGAGVMIAWLVFAVILLRSFGWMSRSSFVRIYRSKSITEMFKIAFSEAINMKVDYQTNEYKSRSKILRRSLGVLLAMVLLFAVGITVEMKSIHPYEVQVGEF